MVHGMEAANMIASLPSAARYPDKEYVHFLFVRNRQFCLSRFKPFFRL